MKINYLGSNNWRNQRVSNITPVKIGVIDGPNNDFLFKNFKEKKHFVAVDKVDDINSRHTSIVCSIIHDIAPASEIYIAEVSERDGEPMRTKDINSALKWLVQEKKVDIINMSLGFYENCEGNCDWEARFEKLKSKYKVDIIVSAGNSRPGKTDTITCPACAPSAISVGALDHEDRVDKHINLKSLITTKPEVYVTGFVSYEVESGYLETVRGTSFSAPIITALISKNYNVLNKDFSYPVALNNLENLMGYFEKIPPVYKKLEETIYIAKEEQSSLLQSDKEKILDTLEFLGIMLNKDIKKRPCI